MDEEKDVVLMIADISGYTRFLISNHKALVHSQRIISDLIRTIIKEVDVPLEVSKLEGDAVFLYCAKDSSWEQNRQMLSRKLASFFSVFSSKVRELSVSQKCGCNACQNIEKLKLKIIVHSGSAVFYELGRFYELAGADVIIVHRLLKNSLMEKEYILMTEDACNDIEFQGEPFKKIEEEYDEIGRINANIYLPQVVA